DDISKARPVTDEKERPIREYYWSRGSDYILYMQDKGGTEDFLLYATDPKTGTTRNLTPFEHTRVMMIQISVKHPNEIMVGLNNRDPKWHDAWVVDIKTGKMRLVFKNEGEYGGFVADDDFNIHYVQKSTPDGGFVWKRIGAGGAATDFMAVPGDDSLTTGLLGFDTAGTTLYAFESRGRDKSALVTLNPETGAATVIGQSDKADVASIIAD